MPKVTYNVPTPTKQVEVDLDAVREVRILRNPAVLDAEGEELEPVSITLRLWFTEAGHEYVDCDLADLTSEQRSSLKAAIKAALVKGLADANIVEAPEE
jgi:hypothetical protein